MGRGNFEVLFEGAVRMSEADKARAHLPAHPTAKHTWVKSDDVNEWEHYDEMPMAADGEIYEPNENPRHRAELGLGVAS